MGLAYDGVQIEQCQALEGWLILTEHTCIAARL